MKMGTRKESINTLGPDTNLLVGTNVMDDVMLDIELPSADMASMVSRIFFVSVCPSP